MTDVGRIALVCGVSGEPTNAILAYTHLLDTALREQGVASTVAEVQHALPDLRDYDAVVLQYNPFLYGRWGFAPHVVAAFAAAHRRPRRPRLALMLHETWFPISGWRSALIGGWQRLQLRALHLASDVVFASIQRWTEVAAAWRPRRPAFHLPVGSNLPHARADRESVRRELGVSEATVVLGAFGTADPSRLVDYIAGAANSVARHHESVLMLNLGSGARELPRLDARVRVLQPGLLPPAQVARLLAAGDVFLAPFADGVSTRRGSLMAALQHGLAVIGTHGELTDPLLRESHALELVPVGERDAFAEAAVSLAADAPRRCALATAAAALYEQEFAWRVLAARMAAALG